MKLLKAILFMLALTNFCVSTHAQSNVPEGIYYQAVARNDDGNEMVNESLSLQISVREDTNIIYTETHTVTTDEFGLFELTIGAGQVENGVFADISWEEETYFLVVELDDGDGYEIISETQFLSMPFSFYAKKAYEVEIDNVDDADADNTNELINSFSIENDSLKLTEAGQDFTVPLSAFGSDEDWEYIDDTTINTAPAIERVGIQTSNPSSTLQIGGSVSYNVTTVSSELTDVSSVSLSESNSIVLCNVNLGGIDINLPSAADCTGRTYTIKKYDSTSLIGLALNPVNVIPATGETIDVQNVHEMDENSFQEITIISDGANWLIISRSTFGG